MKRKTKILLGILLGVIILGTGLILLIRPASQSAPKTDKFAMHFFHETACGSCDGTKEFFDIYQEQLKDVDRETYPCDVFTHNVFQTSGREKWESMCEEWDIDPSSMEFPVLLINGRAISGLENIKWNLREQYLTAIDHFGDFDHFMREKELSDKNLFKDWKVNRDHLTVVYCHRYVCPECIETSPVLEQLPKEVEVNGKMIPVDLVKINTRDGRGGDRVRQLFEAYGVPDEEQGVPIIFLTNEYLSGIEAISENLLPLLEQGEGLDFRWPK